VLPGIAVTTSPRRGPALVGSLPPVLPARRAARPNRLRWRL